MIASFLPLKLSIFVAEGIYRCPIEIAEIENILLTMVMVHGSSFLSSMYHLRTETPY